MDEQPTYGPPEPPEVESTEGGEQSPPPKEKTHDGAPHDQHASEPLGPMTPDDETPLGDSPEVHSDITPHDIPLDHPGRKAAEEMAAEGDGTLRGNV